MQHLDEGTIHAWLDGELSADEAEKIAAHANECRECGALVAEARGLIAASTRILTALDDVPAGVVPSGSSVPEKPVAAGGPAFRRPWYSRTDLRAAAALLFVAGASLVAVRAGRKSESANGVAMIATSAARSESPLQDSGVPVAADVAQQEKASEVKPMVGGAVASVAPAERRRSEKQVAASPPALSSKVALREPAAAPLVAPAPATANAMDAVSDANALNKLRSDAPMAGRVQGQVMDRAKGKGLPAANVIVEGTKLSAMTDEEGRFIIDSVPAGDRRLTARRIGYMAQTVPLAVKKESGATATVTLAPATTTLDEVIVSSVAAGAAGATAKAATTPTLRVLKVDSTGTNRSVVYEVSPGVQVTLVEAPLIVAEKDQMANQKTMQRTRDSTALEGTVSGVRQRANAAKTDRAAAAPAPMAISATVHPQINSISWSDQNRRYTLSGPLKPAELEAIKARLMKMRR
jgi:hypothetical protein